LVLFPALSGEGDETMRNKLTLALVFVVGLAANSNALMLTLDCPGGFEVGGLVPFNIPFDLAATLPGYGNYDIAGGSFAATFSDNTNNSVLRASWDSGPDYDGFGGYSPDGKLIRTRQHWDYFTEEMDWGQIFMSVGSDPFQDPSIGEGMNSYYSEEVFIMESLDGVNADGDLLVTQYYELREGFAGGFEISSDMLPVMWQPGRIDYWGWAWGGGGADAGLFFDGATLTLELTPVPEPSTLALLCAGLAGFGALWRKQKS
jgi:hypothetical protein